MDEAKEKCLTFPVRYCSGVTGNSGEWTLRRGKKPLTAQEPKKSYFRTNCQESQLETTSKLLLSVSVSSKALSVTTLKLDVFKRHMI